MVNPDIPILIVDDAKFSTKVILRCLQSGGYTQIKHVTSAADAVNLISDGKISIVIADWLMPSMDGIELTRRIRQIDKETNRYTYIIMLTAKDGINDFHLAFDEGIDDFINKSAMQQQLLPRVFAAERIVDNQNRLLKDYNALLNTNHLLENQNSVLQRLSTIDALTGLGNDTYAQLKLRDNLNHTRARGGASCLVLMTINNKNQVASKLPETILDEIITGVSRRLKTLIRPLDDVARISPFEFAVITHQPDLDRCDNHSFKRIFEAINHREFKTAMGFKSITIEMAVVAASAELELPTTEAMLTKARLCIENAKTTKRVEYYHFNSNVPID